MFYTHIDNNKKYKEVNIMYSIFQVAKWFLDKEPYMSAKKLQKICWFAYSWFIALNYDPEEKNGVLFLIKGKKPEAWVHGPVFVDLYADFKYNNYGNTHGSEEITNVEIIEFLNRIYEVYGKYTGDDLENISHQELPWKNARKGLAIFDSCREEIKVEDILEEYLPRLV